MQSAKLTIPGRLPGLNELLGSANRHWAVGNRMKKDAMEKVLWYCKAARLPTFIGKVSVKIACYEKTKRRDEDNVISGATKVILDALQRGGYLAGDGQKYIRLIPQPVSLDRRNPRIEIEIVEVEL